MTSFTLLATVRVRAHNVALDSERQGYELVLKLALPAATEVAAKTATARAARAAVDSSFPRVARSG